MVSKEKFKATMTILLTPMFVKTNNVVIIATAVKIFTMKENGKN